MSIQQLRHCGELAGITFKKGEAIEKSDLVNLLLQNACIGSIIEKVKVVLSKQQQSKPQSSASECREKLQAMSIRQLRCCGELAGIAFEKENVIEKSDMVNLLLLNSAPIGSIIERVEDNEQKAGKQKKATRAPIGLASVAPAVQSTPCVSNSKQMNSKPQNYGPDFLGVETVEEEEEEAVPVVVDRRSNKNIVMEEDTSSATTTPALSVRAVSAAPASQKKRSKRSVIETSEDYEKEQCPKKRRRI